MGNPLQLGMANYSKGAYITIEGKAALHFYIIRSGRVRIERELNILSQEENTNLKAGDFFGVVSTMSNHIHIENAIALDDCSLITIRPDQYSMLIKRNTPIAMKIINSFSRQVRFLDQALTMLTFKSSVEADERHLYQVGEYYAKQNQYSLAFYAYYKYCMANPSDPNIESVKQKMAKIKPYANTSTLKQDTSQFIRQYPKDTMLFAEGESGPELYIIQKGSIRITKIVNDNEVLLAFLKAGDIFGEMALLENKPRSASAIVNEDSVLMAVNRANFQEMVIEQPKIISRLTSTLAERIWNLFRQLKNTSIKDPVGRIYDCLVLQLEKSKIDITVRQAFNFGFGINDLINMVGLPMAEGKGVVSKLLENNDITISGQNIYTPDITRILKSNDYYKKMERRRNTLESNR
ncbi:MAG: cAMP-binding protein [Spirochaeta sp. LUC14_002_19_P3]|nr:MAG: cAMP-binding protein [Spirochaeta sp. LUC14_002_19_P3]